MKYNTLKETMINRIIQVEGGYVNRPDDSGGPTNYGVTETVARAHGYNGDMKYLSRDLAFEIYSARYWDSVMGDNLCRISEKVCYEVVDTAINMGTITAVKFLQRALNVLNRKGSLYQDIEVDGYMGSKTLEALLHYVARREEKIIVRMLNCLQGAFYVELAERREKDEAFVYGWFVHRVIVGGDNV